jgi:uncharacterized protein (TIGR02147 family)
MDIFKCSSVVEVIFTHLRQGNEQVPHGARARLAKVMSCHTSYLAQVLSGVATLSQEQALAFCLWAGLSAEQIEFFLAMLNHERAGSHELRDFYAKKKDQLIERQGKLGRSLSANRLEEEQQVEFFSQWEYQAVLSALQIPSLHSVGKIAEFLAFSLGQTEKTLRGLKKLGLAEVTKERWKSLQSFVHFHGENPEVRQKFHLSWRLKALEKNFMRPAKAPRENLNFSSLLTLDRAAQEKIRQKIQTVIGEISRDLKEVPSEQLSVLNIDLFRLS